MKRNKTSSRTMRRRGTTVSAKGNSHYARKVARGQMYGNGATYHGGCCAHGIRIANWPY